MRFMVLIMRTFSPKDTQAIISLSMIRMIGKSPTIGFDLLQILWKLGKFYYMF